MSYDYFEDGEELGFRWLRRAWECVVGWWPIILAVMLIGVGITVMTVAWVHGDQRESAMRAVTQSQLEECEKGDMLACADCSDSEDACKSQLRAYFLREKGE